ncbi:uncharacterized protein MELLADRAFT_111406 [Melampsora larici-populina 98AG31]|uniref:PX domain-containing protein n=1 Tax=Melampsora larici-populina (strain 98AG31 / pathotype 3-4-7) TaxID=747676 RepID=F4S338_MELLP|nr:uncharacterized protein MELLADRAFT_111406 [Melampsora larici-populina 98AG31]EGG00912.1 hypothetical protein MELLADRAFT_111406 [Melampsora larici-populina 98AG31]
MNDENSNLCSTIEFAKRLAKIDADDISHSTNRSERTSLSSRRSSLAPKPPPKPPHLHSVSSRADIRQPLRETSALRRSVEVDWLNRDANLEGDHKVESLKGQGCFPQESVDIHDTFKSTRSRRKMFDDSTFNDENQKLTSQHSTKSDISVEFGLSSMLAKYQKPASSAWKHLSSGSIGYEQKSNDHSSPSSTIKAPSSRNKIADVRTIYTHLQHTSVPQSRTEYPLLDDAKEAQLLETESITVLQAITNGSFLSDDTKAQQLSTPSTSSGARPSSDERSSAGKKEFEETIDARSWKVQSGTVESNLNDSRESCSLDMIDPRLLSSSSMTTSTYCTENQLSVPLDIRSLESTQSLSQDTGPSIVDNEIQTRDVESHARAVPEESGRIAAQSARNHLGTRNSLSGPRILFDVSEGKETMRGQISDSLLDVKAISPTQIDSANFGDTSSPTQNKAGGYDLETDPVPDINTKGIEQSSEDVTPHKHIPNPSIKTSNLLERAPQSPSAFDGSPVHLATPKMSRKRTMYHAGESPVSKLCSPVADPSVSVTKDVGAIFRTYGMSGTACSVTASDAIIAARAKALPDIPRKNIPNNQQRTGRGKTFSWAPIFQGKDPEASVAQTYILEGPSEDQSNSLDQRIDVSEGEKERYEIGFGPRWKSTGPLFCVKVHSPETRRDQSNTIHTVYAITSSFVSGQETPALEVTVDRRYSHFEKLALILQEIYGEVLVLPNLPEKRFAGRFSAQFIELRRSGLERYLTRLIRNPVLRYSHFITTFLGCEDDEEFEKQAAEWKDLIKAVDVISTDPHPQNSHIPAIQFFSRVYHPDYNVDPIDTHYAIGAFSKHIRSLEVGRGITNVEQSFTKVRANMQDLSTNLHDMSQELNRLAAGLALPSRKLESNDDLHRKDESDEEEENRVQVESSLKLSFQKDDNFHEENTVAPFSEEALKTLRRKGQNARLQNSEGALCWKKNCQDCLSMTKALQLMGQTIEEISRSYSISGVDQLAPVEALLKEISCPLTDYHTLCKLGVSVEIDETLETEQSQDEVEDRRDTVLNVIMCEIDRHHEERNQDLRDISARFVDSQLQLHHQAYTKLQELKNCFTEPEYTRLGTSGPRAPNSEERRLLAEAAKHQTSNTMLDWVQSAVNRPRALSVTSNSTARSNALSTIFTQPVSAAVTSVMGLRNLFHGSGS